MLNVKNIEVKYGKVILALQNISIDVPQGAVAAILGPNGAGKTTILKAISGLLRTEEGAITKGSIVFKGEDIHRYMPEDIARKGIIQVGEGGQVLPNLTVEENLLVGAAVIRDRGKIKRNLEMVYSYFPKLSDLRNATSGYLSGGERQMLGIGRALMASPEVMLLDEPSLGLAPILIDKIYNIIEKINREEKMSIILVEQNAKRALSVSKYAYFIETGVIVKEGPSSDLIEDGNISQYYFGASNFDK